MEDTIRVLIAMALTGVLVMLRLDAARFGTAEYDEPVVDQDGKAVLDAKGQPVTRGAKLTEQVVHRLAEIPRRIDDGAVQVECDQAAAYVAHDVGVSQTVTRTTGNPCSRDTS